MKFIITNRSFKTEGRKYRLIRDEHEDGFFRIQALIDFVTKAGCVVAGDIGGLVSGEHNLSQEGNCWIHGTAAVLDAASIFDNAQVFGNASVHGTAWGFG